MDINVDDQYVKTGYGSSSATDDYDQYDDIQPSCELEEEDHLVLGLRKGPWTVEEDSLLIHHINIHGEGRWNSLARHAGLKRSGKSCRLRWLNYLRPNVRRGNITLQEQLLILQLHSRWGNRWSKIAEFLPGRTDNEIKNYWRTRVQKHAKQLKCDVNSKQFQHAMHYVWIPRLIERIRASPESPSGQPTQTTYTTNIDTPAGVTTAPGPQYWVDPNFVPEISAAISSDSSELQASSFLDPITSYPPGGTGQYCSENGSGFYQGFEQIESNMNWSSGGDSVVESLWIEENIWFLQQQLSDD